jgi:GT2 family glycosyltransferase
MEQEPVVSIITAVLNGVGHLDRCLQSVASQRGIQCEHLVADGGSSDGTAEIIKRHTGQLAWWVSEPDRGISEAMNKGIAHARGEWLLFLHADDALSSPDAIVQVLPELGSGYDVVACSLEYGDGLQRRLRRPRPPGFWLNFKTGLLHQATLIRRDLFYRIGPFDERYKIAMDYEFFLRAHRQGAKVRLCPEIRLSLMGGSGISSRRDWPSLSARLKEESLIQSQHCTSSFLRAMYCIYWVLYLPYRRMRATLENLVSLA